MTDLKSFLDRCAAAGASLELQPWQVECLERWRGGEIRRLSIGELGRRGYNARKQLMLDVVAAHAIASGESVRILAPTRERAEEARQRALSVLDTLDRMAGP